MATPRGFCAGVDKAIDALAWMVKIFDPPIYCYHEIVHNRPVVEEFRRKGVIFVDSVDSVPAGAPLVLSAHGTSPQIVAQARTAGSVVVDAVCPLVTKVHHEVKTRAARGYDIIYIGHAGHEEVVGTSAIAPAVVHLVQSNADVDALATRLDPRTPVALIAQTTLAESEWRGIMDHVCSRFDNVWTPSRADLCFATTNRQAAVRAVARASDAVVVIGSQNSSNTLSLAQVARDAGCNKVVRINDASELPSGLSGVIGVTAGASAPERLVSEIVEALAPAGPVEEVRVTDEGEYFPPPPELREMLSSLETFLATTFSAGATAGVTASANAPRTLRRHRAPATANPAVSHEPAVPQSPVPPQSLAAPQSVARRVAAG